jgi:hypothetical protein
VVTEWRKEGRKAELGAELGIGGANGGSGSGGRSAGAREPFPLYQRGGGLAGRQAHVVEWAAQLRHACVLKWGHRRPSMAAAASWLSCHGSSQG